MLSMLNVEIQQGGGEGGVGDEAIATAKSEKR
jgi:hypothetical protein